MKMIPKRKFILGSVSGVFAVAITATALCVGLNKTITTENPDNISKSLTDVVVSVPTTLDITDVSAEQPSNEKTILDVGGSTNNQSSTPTKTPSVSNGGVTQGTKNPSSNNTQTAIDKPNAETPSKGGGGVVSVTPVKRPDEPVAPSGSKPQTTDWIGINSNVPQELYNYDYTVIDQTDLLTGKQLEYRGFNDWDKAAESAVGALTTYYTVDYRNIGSTAPKDKDKYLKSLVYWVGESADADICEYMQSVKDNEIISKASVVTDRSLIYNNGRRLIRARVYVTFESGASAYGLQNGVKYYKDVEVSVYASTGEDRYGYGKGADFNALLFSDNCFNTLCDFKKT